MRKLKWLQRFLLVVLIAAPLVMAGCSGDDGSNGSNGKSAYQIAVDNGFQGTEQEWLASLNPSDPVTAANNVEAESCSTCHNGTAARSGDSHQAQYDSYFQQGVVQVTGITYANDGTDDTVSFTMTKSGAAFDCTQADALNIGYTQYDAATRSFTAPGGNRINLKGTVTYDSATGVCTSVNPQTSLGDLSATNGVIAVYGRDETAPIEFEGTHIAIAKYPFAALQVEGTVDYSSDANVTGCEKCHTKPYYKHGYIIGDVGSGTANAGVQDFWTCKVCHIDNGPGGHLTWQISVDNPQRWAEIVNGSPLTAAEEAQYAYKTRLMNDVHMSHAMEFPYPMSMRNCATCHEGKLAQTLSDANFTLETCKSCHPITGGTDYPDAQGNFAVDTRDMALKTIWEKLGVSSFHVDASGNVTATPCNNCHKDPAAGGIGKTFSQIHTGYDPKIYDTAGEKYADGIAVSIDSATYTAAANTIDIAFSATGSVGGLNATDIVPTVQVALYGYNTKDFIASNHDRDADGNRLGEFTLDGTSSSPYFSNPVIGGDGTWSVTYTLPSSWAAMIADGTVKRAEIAVLPSLENASGVTVGLNAPSKTLNLADDAFQADYFSGTNAIVSVDGSGTTLKGCNSCHDQLATTFHSGNRGGNIVVCRMCHTVMSGGSHLEGQSRSIDSYVHAIHTFQAFNIDSIDFTDPVEAAKYEEETTFLFPDFGVINCEACHNAGKFNVPDQSKSMPGVLSATDAIPGMSIPSTDTTVVGPAARACGACHKGEAIKENEGSEFASISRHMADNGYQIENTDSVLDIVIKKIMSMFQ